MSHIQSLLILGCGYVGEHLAKVCLHRGMRVLATTRRSERASELTELGLEVVLVAAPEDLPEHVLQSVDAVLDSIPLTRSEQALYASQPAWLPDLAVNMGNIQWAGYLSTTGVYGDSKSSGDAIYKY